MKTTLFTRRLERMVLAGCWLLFTMGAASAGPLNYPKDKPAFRLVVPEGWKAAEDTARAEHLLSFAPKDGKPPYQIYFLSTVGGGAEGLGTAAGGLAVATVGSNPKITGVQFGEPAESTLAARVPVGRTDAVCKIEGEPTYFLFAVFCPLGGRRFEAVLCAPLPAKDVGARTLDSILHSIQPIEPEE